MKIQGVACAVQDYQKMAAEIGPVADALGLPGVFITVCMKDASKWQFIEIALKGECLVATDRQAGDKYTHVYMDPDEVAFIEFEVFKTPPTETKNEEAPNV